jgi:hypothetical protein
MRDSFTPEEVDQIENKAYEVGVGIGASQERERIIALLNSYCDANRHAFCECPAFIALIKGENSAL